MNVKAHILAERRELVTLLETLSPDQWSTPSLCGHWSVRDVAIHVSMDSVTMPRYFLAALHNLSANRVNERYVTAQNDVPTDILVDRLAASATTSWFARYAPRLTLSDHVVHQQDIRRPLGLPRTIDPERLRLVLDRPDPFAQPRRFTKGLRFTASDLPWEHGTGPEVHGRAEALALAMVGRASVLDGLEGDGVDVLRARMSHNGN
ncbi:maleylpyruvate isomerase family mycothiol-dependent enzyme [Rhodococcus globerulus]|uniref:maleylpyruvate isomerase family mycothiol-dependent enzyme n=1 Tax=Rhodococcus globerulus TaxID=33008 RepID=UPI003019059E